jgi:hypothetical protein
MTDDADSTTDGGNRRALVIGIVVVVVAFVGALVFLNGNDDETAETTVDSTTEPTAVESTPAPTSEPSTTDRSTTEPPATDPTTTDAPTTENPTTEPTGPPTTEFPAATSQAIWPWVDTPTRFDDPVAAATSFAVDYLGFTDPRVGDFQAGDSRSGEVPVRAGAVGPTTVVLVRQLTEDDTWWVLGAAAENITIESPDQGATVSSPLTVAGTALAFEGTVDVELRADDHGEPIATDFVTGSGGPEPGPFEDEIEFTSPGAIGGALVLISRSSEDGAPVLEAAAMRIFFE